MLHRLEHEALPIISNQVQFPEGMPQRVRTCAHMQW
jgi:hypothetical protein